MKISTLSFAAFVLLLCGLICSFKTSSGDHPTLAIGAQAPDFSLPGVDGKTYSLSSFKNSPILVIVFTCNHCPTAQAYEDRVIRLAADYKNKGVAVAAIMPNDPQAIRLDELGYTDLSDSFDEMKLRAKQKHFNFPYLYDGATQSVAKAYGPIATPHVFIFDQNRKLCYSGRIDDVEKPTKTPHIQDTRNALNNLLAHKKPQVATTKVFGCSIKWAEKEDWKQRARDEWAKEPVKMDTIGAAGIKQLMQNKSDSLRLIVVWSAMDNPSITTFGKFVDMNRMYRRRDFQFISINTDGPANCNQALKFLQQSQASATNFIFNSGDKHELNGAVDPMSAKWQADLPFTLLVEPGGKIVYAKHGVIDAAEVKKAIVDDPVIGRYY
ncbi:MAG TPA: redoxin domain-containing protein [Mucilaginibacter sp.]|jgi:peroxiredoxin